MAYYQIPIKPNSCLYAINNYLENIMEKDYHSDNIKHKILKINVLGLYVKKTTKL